MAIDVEPWLLGVPEGWHALLRALGRDIAAVCPKATIVQAKEKFGELRVYLSGANRAAFDRVDAAEQRSRSLCQRCGRPAQLMVDDGFYATLCPDHGRGFVPVKEAPIVTLRVRFRMDDDEDGG
ncbi:hypothetical protein SAMN06295912_12259 [Sphingomonas laterariae]|uniref:Uncharacterized protein n=1 Tax=Edaphosphingomonas laterariae TaxID=861865 RepID=A0A239IAD9_9SPHN|nr:hypothetical protein [Sphingomonas laterariae]SNS90033.1 hypothetical protein SAMN06295912_12259 [Sphingomonas laterariae]